MSEDANKKFEIPLISSFRQEKLKDNLDEKLSAKYIVREIVQSGMSQKQIMYIIRGLALELEDIALSKSIYTMVGSVVDKNTIVMPKVV